MENCQFIRSDGKKSGKLGYGETKPIANVESIQNARKVKVGLKNFYGGVVTHISFYDSEDKCIAGGESSLP
jgi:hypothetical protein